MLVSSFDHNRVREIMWYLNYALEINDGGYYSDDMDLTSEADGNHMQSTLEPWTPPICLWYTAFMEGKTAIMAGALLFLSCGTLCK